MSVSVLIVIWIYTLLLYVFTHVLLVKGSVLPVCQTVSFMLNVNQLVLCSFGIIQHPKQNCFDDFCTLFCFSTGK